MEEIKILFLVVKDDKDEKFWGKGQTAGHEVNSAFHEGSVFMSLDGQSMYFSSQGHSSIGGYDIFVSYRDKNGLWGKPINLGTPINTPYDELYFSISANGNMLIFLPIEQEEKEGWISIKLHFGVLQKNQL